MNHETEYDTDFDPERYATKMVLYDGAILLLSMAVVAIVYALMV